MIFSTQQMILTHNFINNADEAAIKSVFARLDNQRLKTMLKLIGESMKNRDPHDDCLCARCRIHAVNREDGIDICPSCFY